MRMNEVEKAKFQDWGVELDEKRFLVPSIIEVYSRVWWSSAAWEGFLVGCQGALWYPRVDVRMFQVVSMVF